MPHCTFFFIEITGKRVLSYVNPLNFIMSEKSVAFFLRSVLSLWVWCFFNILALNEFCGEVIDTHLYVHFIIEH